MMTTALLALVLVAAPPSIMFKQAKPAMQKQVEKKIAAKKASTFVSKVQTAALQLSAMYTEKLGQETTVLTVFVAEPNMGFVVFKNDKGTFALLFVEEEGELKVLPRDFNEL